VSIVDNCFGQELDLHRLTSGDADRVVALGGRRI